MMARSSTDEVNTEAAQDNRGLGEGALQRAKYWSEISIEEKIERMRTLVKSLVLTSDNQRRELEEVRSFIWDHAHEENGDVVIKVKKSERFKLQSMGGGLGSINKYSTNGKSENADDVYI